MPHGTYGIYEFLEWQLTFGNVDKLSKVFAYIFSIMGVIGIIYSIHVDNDGEILAAFYYVGGALGVTLAGDFLTLFLFWEIMAFSSVFLIWYRKSEFSVEVGFRYLLWHVTGGLILLAGIIIKYNLSGDLNDDMVVDILDIVSTVNMVLTGGLNSPDFTDCQKTDADVTGDGTINILDVIQIINLVLGNGLSLNDSIGGIDYVDATYRKEGNDLFLTFDSKYAVGLEIALPGIISNAMLDVPNQPDFTLATKNTNKCVIYSPMNKTFNNNSLTLQISGVSEFDIKDINVIAGNDVGQEMSVRWLAPEVHNFEISKMYPNPFNPVTQIDYNVNQAGELRLSVYNILGQEVSVLHNGYQPEGEFKVTWDASSLSSGVYYVSMVMNGQMETMKAVLVK